MREPRPYRGSSRRFHDSRREAVRSFLRRIRGAVGNGKPLLIAAGATGFVSGITFATVFAWAPCWDQPLPSGP